MDLGIHGFRVEMTQDMEVPARVPHILFKAEVIFTRNELI